ncbi:hypothetical protein [Corynebacterium belfantii]|uniref:hypothetical protein n=1 Tax=Corynebacterium belfantii TaxID=2014537 RepID=UPI001FD49972|nr:hypothetical protein [Corynebacterium belfantii]
MTYLAHRAFSWMMRHSPLIGEDVLVVLTDFFGRRTGIILTAIYWFTVFPVLVFTFSYDAALSQFCLSMQKHYGETTDKHTEKVIHNTTILLTAFTMFFVWPSALAMGTDGMKAAHEHILPVLSYFANVTGTIEGTQYLFIFITTSLVGVFNPSILNMITLVGGIFFTFITYLLLMIVVHKVDAFAQFRGRPTNYFVSIMGLIVLGATIWGMV